MDWHWTEDAFPPVAFCVRALVLDSISVPPFDRHADGDHHLRELGLDAAMWRAWVAAVAEQRAIMGEHTGKVATPDAGRPWPERARAAAEVVRAPGSFCPGSDELRARLNALYADQAIAGEAWKRRMSDPHSRIGSGRQQRALWDAMAPFRDRLATLSCSWSNTTSRS